MERFSAVIFDLDGTLLDTLADLADSANQALHKLGFPEHEVKAYRYFVGDGVSQLMYRCLPDDRRHDDNLIERAVKLMSDNYSRQWHHCTRPYPGIPELIRQLQTAGIPQAVLSNKPDHFTRRVTNHFFPENPFALVQGHKENIPRKPDPAGALAVAEKLGVRPERIFYLGDTSTDMQTAVSAGMYPVGACWGFRSRRELEEHGAKELAESPGEVETMIGIN